MGYFEDIIQHSCRCCGRPVYSTQGHVKVKLSGHNEFVHYNCAVDENWVTESNYIKPVPSKHIHGRKENDGYLFGLLNKIDVLDGWNLD